VRNWQKRSFTGQVCVRGGKKQKSESQIIKGKARYRFRVFRGKRKEHTSSKIGGFSSSWDVKKKADRISWRMGEVFVESWAGLRQGLQA